MKTIIIDKPNFIIENNHYENLTIIVEKGVKASLVELFLENKSNTSTYERIIELEENAQLNYVKYQDLNSNFNMNFQFDLKNSSTLNMTNFELGNSVNVNKYSANLNHDKIEVTVNGLVKLYENSNSSSHFNTIHNAKNCLSNINYKHSLHDKTKALFQAKTVVNNTALYSQAYQICNTLLLSDDATIFTQPHLEILVDELKASHGATTGSINKDELLYLQSRGIGKDKAYDMLLKAFENEIYDNINDKKIVEFLKQFKRSDYV